MIIKEIITNRFQFKDWVRDPSGQWNSISKVLLGDSFSSLVVLTIYETSDVKVNADIQKITRSILEDLEMIDKEVKSGDFRYEMLLEKMMQSGAIVYTLMFFKNT